LNFNKATVEVPSSVAGTVESIQVKEGDTVKEGVVLIKVKTTSASSALSDSTTTMLCSTSICSPTFTKISPTSAFSTPIYSS
jgi:pyruvate dehydrogenase E2 component (dihydrolipoamide acetyltransferase)